MPTMKDFVLFMVSFYFTIQAARLALLHLKVDSEFHPVALFSVGILFYTSDHLGIAPQRKARLFELVNKAHMLTCALIVWQITQEGAQYQLVVRLGIMVVSTISSYIAMKVMRKAANIDD